MRRDGVNQAVHFPRERPNFPLCQIAVAQREKAVKTAGIHRHHNLRGAGVWQSKARVLDGKLVRLRPSLLLVDTGGKQTLLVPLAQQCRDMFIVALILL